MTGLALALEVGVLDPFSFTLTNSRSRQLRVLNVSNTEAIATMQTGLLATTLIFLSWKINHHELSFHVSFVD